MVYKYTTYYLVHWLVGGTFAITRLVSFRLALFARHNKLDASLVIVTFYVTTLYTILPGNCALFKTVADKGSCTGYYVITALLPNCNEDV